jgi:electron transfer flavoprotein-quinone oxidoreductase
MTEQEQFDVIIVGAGPGGCSTAIRLMQNNPDLNVALIDRGQPIGSKNVSGGILWGPSLSEIIPDWWDKAPIERRIVQKRTGFLTRENVFFADFHYPTWAKDPPNAVSLLLGKFVSWMVQEAENHGVNVFEGINVDDLSRDATGRLNGIIQSGDLFETNVVVIADGANSRLTLSSGLRSKMKRENYGLGVKEILRLPKGAIEERFNLVSDTGLAAEYVIGGLRNDVRSGGFLYTNEDTISLGVVIQIDTLNDPNFPPVSIYESFKQHPHIEKLIEDAEPVQYSAHWVPEGGIHMLPKLYDDHVLVVGDAAGFVLSNGVVIQGINYAITSGVIAADTIYEAHQKNDFSRKSLKLYENKVKNSFIWKDLKTFKSIHKITRNPRIYNQYPEILLGIFDDMLTEQGQPKKHVFKLFRQRKKQSKVGWLRLLRDGLSFRHF